MTWLVWRQHRNQLLFGVGALAVLAAFFIATGVPMHDRFERMGLPDCLPATVEQTVVVDLGPAVGGAAGTPVDDAAGTAASDGAGTSVGGAAEPPPELDAETLAAGRCAQTARKFFDDYQNVIFAGLLLLTLPMLVGMFWGAPLVAREIEHGTHRLVWTQGVSRLRWAVTKIGLVSTGVLALTAIYAALLAWWISPVMQTSGQQFSYIFFDIHGIVVFGYVLFALALGVFAGTVTGRLMSAMAATVVGFIGARLVVMLVARTRFLPTEKYTLQDITTNGLGQMRNDLHGDWILAENADRGAAVLTIHPADQFWVFQAIETTIFVTVAIGLLSGSIYWIRRRIA